MLNYHELTMNEPRGSPAKRKQFIVICCVMGFVLGNTLINAGAFNSVRISKGKFAGGEFVHKSLERDYVAFVGLARTVGSDAGVAEADQDGVIYSVLLDVDSSAGVPGGSERLMTGVLNGGEATTKELLALNDNMTPIGPDAFVGDYNEGDKFGAHIPYETGSLPSVDAGVCQFVYTGGFMSALIYQYKVFPQLLGQYKFITTTMKIDEIATAGHFRSRVRDENERDGDREERKKTRLLVSLAVSLTPTVLVTSRSSPE